MIKIFKHTIFLGIMISLLTACSSTQGKLQEILQTSSATKVKNDYQKTIELLVTFKQKLDKKNLNNYNKRISNLMYINLQDMQNNIDLKIDNLKLTKYEDYLKYAFDKNVSVANRNDLLIVGIYKLIYEAYEIGKGHQLTALSYDKIKLQKLYYNLNSIKYRIKFDKDNDGKYLFLTWQKNWQIQLQQELSVNENPSWKIIQNLNALKGKSETLFDTSDFEFEVLLSKMIYNVKNTLTNVGEEPVDVGIEAMKSLVIFL